MQELHELKYASWFDPVSAWKVRREKEKYSTREESGWICSV